MATIILRDAGSISSPGSTAKGSPLTNLEVDNNFSNINVTLGVLSNLTTSATSNLVSAINSIKGNSLNQFASTTSSQLAGVISDETGSGALVFATSPTLVTPALGTPSSGTLTNATGLPLTSGVTGTLPIANGGTGTSSTTFVSLTTNVTGTLPVGNGGTGITSLGAGVATFLGTPSSSNLATAVTDETGSGALVFATSPTLVTPALGTPSSGTLTNTTGLPLSSGVTGTLPIANGGTGTSSTTFVSLTTNVTGTLPVSNGGTGSSTLAGAGIAQLSGSTFTGTQIFSDQQVTRAMLIDCGLTFLDKGNSSTTTQDLNYTQGSHQKITATGNFSITTSNFPPAGNLGELLLELVNGGSYTITWPTIYWIKPDGTTTTSISTYLTANSGRTALQTSGTDFIILWSRDAGSTIYGRLV